MYPKSLARINWFSASLDDPRAILVKLANPLSEFLPLPSEILYPIDANDLLI